MCSWGEQEIKMGMVGNGWMEGLGPISIGDLNNPLIGLVRTAIIFGRVHGLALNAVPDIHQSHLSVAVLLP